MKKRILSLVVVLSMILQCMPLISHAAVVNRGTCGTNLTWVLDTNGILTISGTGDMTDYWGDLFDTRGWGWDYNNENSDMNKIKKIKINNGVTSIGRNAFSRCKNVSYVSIPDSVKKIGVAAFANCRSLNSITIPASVTIIEYQAFERCESLNIYVSKSNVNYSDINGVLFNKDKTILVAYSKDKICNEYSIPNNVEIISDSAFRSCKYLTKLSFPSSVTKVAMYGFQYCSSLTDVYYNGSNAQWNNIVIVDGNDELKNATVHCNSAGPDAPIHDLSVEVRDSATNKLIPNSQITLYSNAGNSKSYRLSNGQITLNNTIFPIYKIFASASGYNTSTVLQNVNYPSSGKIVFTLTENKPQTIPVQGISSIFVTIPKMKIGQTQRLTAYVSPNNATDKSITWSSSNPTVASVSSDGMVTAKNNGTTTIMATSSNNKKASVKITVNTSGVLGYGEYGYSFKNVRESFGYPKRYRIPKERYLQLGYKESAAENAAKYGDLWGGSCFGMSASSILFYKNIMKEERYSSSVSAPYYFNAPDDNSQSEKKLRNMLELLQISSNTKNFRNRFNDFNAAAIAKQIDSGNPVLVLMESISGGHAIVFYGYKKTNSGYYFNIYDCSGFVSGLSYQSQDNFEFDYIDDSLLWKPKSYVTYDDIKNEYNFLYNQNANNAVSLFSVEEEQPYMHIYRAMEDMTITNADGKTVTITDGEINSEIENVSVVKPTYLAEDPKYLIYAPIDEYTIVGSGDDEAVTAVISDGMAAAVTAKSSEAVTFSADLCDISVSSGEKSPYEITYTTFDNIFDELTVLGTASGEVSASLTGAEVVLTGTETVSANATRSEALSSASAETDNKKITIACVETDEGGAELQIKSDNDEEVAAAAMPERKQVASPQYDLESGEYSEGQTLTFTKDDDTVIYYTTDGSEPSAENGILYIMPIKVNKPTTIKAISTRYGYEDSEIVTLEYVLPEITIPVPLLMEGEYTGIQQVDLVADDDVNIYYTIDGDDPITNGELYTCPLVLNDDTTIKACAEQDGCFSEVADYQYTIMPASIETPTPTLTPIVEPTTKPTTEPTIEPTQNPTPTLTSAPTVTPIVKPTTTSTPTEKPKETGTPVITDKPLMPTDKPMPFEIQNKAVSDKVTANIVNISDTSQSGILIFAAYSNDGKLVSVKNQNIDDIAANGTLPCEFDITEGAEKYKLLIWNSWRDMVPLTKSVEIK